MKTNPLNYFGIRKLDVPTSNLECIEIPMSYNLEQAIDKWVNQNCKNRDFIGRTFIKNERENKPNYNIKIGFEDPKELSYFVLACPHLKYK